MNRREKILMTVLISLLSVPLFPQADTVWTLDKCIDYALKQNITVRKSELATERSAVSYDEAKASRLPSANGSIGQSFGWRKGSSGSDFSGSNGTNYSANASITLFNGFRVATQIQQANLNISGSEYALATTKESISLNVLNAFLQVLYAEEQVNNSKKQIESIQEQLRLAGERLTLKAITAVDYSQVRSQLASEKLTLANSESQLSIAKITLMQIMEIPAGNPFTISHPGLKDLLNVQRTPDVKKVYETALSLKPQIKEASINKQVAALDEKIAKASYYPSLSASAGISTGYSSTYTSGYGSQLNDGLYPTAGLSLQVPIYQKNQVKNNIKAAKIGYRDAELSEIDTKNQLRKNIEQACQDVISAQVKYTASIENYNATLESSQLSEEKFNQGFINSVDYLVAKTNLIVAESQLLQSKYNLIFSIKILDFYEGVPLTL
ncbi:MAG TPA: TolC family protein [Bacteroidales bacterium]|nr:TolC family protein [Bacteroidales bacterium]